MDSFKLDYFKKEHKEQSINFTTLSKYECDEVYASFCLAYQIKDPAADDIIIFDNLYKICLMVRHDGAVYILNYKKDE